MNAKPSLQRLLATKGAPRMIRWGVHEGIRGTQWFSLHADGRLNRQHYVPNPKGDLEREDVGRVLPQRFEDVLLQISQVDVDALCPPAPPSPNETSVSLECVWDETRWELAIASGRLDDMKGWAGLSETFRKLTEEASTEGDSDPGQSVE